MTVFDLLVTSPAYLYSMTVLFSLAVGSFLNVVIYRLPVMMEREWREQALEFLEVEPDAAAGDEASGEPFNLVVPRSRCPGCGHQITALENIPVLSWLWLRGRCSGCQTPISARYPAVEVAAAVLAVLAVASFGPTLYTLFVVIATWMLLAAALIDFDTQLLPDQITMPLLWMGLILAALGLSPVHAWHAIYGAAAGYLALWSIFWAFKLLTGKDGMGYGDFKLLAALGAWVGWQSLPTLILLASLVGAIVGGLLIVTGRLGRGQPMSFGPYLAGAGFLQIVYGEQITALWLRLTLGGP